jgi:hypothetical protein
VSAYRNDCIAKKLVMKSRNFCSKTSMLNALKVSVGNIRLKENTTVSSSYRRNEPAGG